jgi:hypothetical protein
MPRHDQLPGNFRRAVVKSWKPDVKWGFLTDDQSGNDVFSIFRS